MDSKQTQQLIADDSTDLTKTIVKQSERLMAFVHRKDFFNKPFSLNIDAHVIHDGSKVSDYLYEEISEKYGDFEEILNEAQGVIEEYPRTAVSDRISKLLSVNLFDKDRNFHGAEDENKNGVIEMRDNMDYLLDIIFNFFVLEIELPPFIETLLFILEHDGLPCGWVGDYPEGKIVVYSNNQKMD